MKQHTQLVLRQMSQKFLEQFDGNLEDADASAFQVYASASRSFQEARELLPRVKSARGNFPVVGIGAFDGLAQPSTDRKPAKSHLAKTTDLMFRVFVLRCPTSVRVRLAQLVVDTLLVFVLISACCVDKLDIVHQNVPTKVPVTAFSPGERAFGTYALGCAVFDAPVLWCNCRGNRTKSQDENDIEDFVAFSIKSLEGFAILDGGATETVSGFMSIQHEADQYEDIHVRWRRNGGGKNEHLHHTLSSSKEFWNQHLFSSAWTCYVSTGWWSSTTTTIVSTVTS